MPQESIHYEPLDHRQKDKPTLNNIDLPLRHRLPSSEKPGPKDIDLPSSAKAHPQHIGLMVTLPALTWPTAIDAKG
jgi:hypothetical protein